MSYQSDDGCQKTRLGLCDGCTSRALSYMDYNERVANRASNEKKEPKIPPAVNCDDATCPRLGMPRDKSLLSRYTEDGKLAPSIALP